MSDKIKASGQNFVVFGATGKTGLELLKQGLSQGHTMTAFVQDSDKLKDIHGVNIVQAELRDKNVMQATIRGNDAVLVSLGSSNRSSSKRTKMIIEAMRQAEVNRIIAVSWYGAGNGNRSFIDQFARMIGVSSFGTGHGNGSIIDWFARKLLSNVRNKYMQEQIIVNSGMDYTIVRTPRIMNKPAHGNLFVTTALSYNFPVEEISRSDVAFFML